MSRIKFMLLSGLAVFAFGAVTAASASASEACPSETGTPFPALCIELVATKGETEVKGKLETEKLNLLIAKTEPPIELQSTGATLGGIIVQPEPLTASASIKEAVIKFTGVAIVGTEGKKCKLKSSEITTVKLKGTAANEDNGKITFEPESGSTFAEFEVENNGTETCPATLKGKIKVKGTQGCDVLTRTVDSKIHLLECLAGESKLTSFGETPTTFEATFEIELGKPSEGKEWSFELV